MRRLCFLVLLPVMCWGQIIPPSPLGMAVFSGKRDTTGKHGWNYGKDHYVAPWGNDSWSGNRTDSAKLTISSAQALLTGAGHRMLLRSGGTWRETATIPNSGTAANPITVTSYGSGNRPIIDAGDSISSAWSAVSTTGNSITHPAGANNPNAPYCFRTLIPPDSVNASGTQVRVIVIGNSVTKSNIGGTFIGQQASSGDVYDMQAGTPVRITWHGGSSIDLLNLSQQDTSDWVNFTFDTSKTNIWSVFVRSAHTRNTTNVTGWNMYYDSGGADSNNIGTPDVSGYSLFGACIPLLIRIETRANPANQYQTTVTTQPNIVTFNDTVGNPVASTAALASDKDWYWSSNVLYIYSTSAPTTRFSKIEAADRANAILISGKDFVAVNNIEMKNGNSAAIGLMAIRNSQGSSITNCSIHDSWKYIVSVDSTSTSNKTKNITVTSNSIYGLWAKGIYSIACYLGNVDTCTVSSNTVYRGNTYTGYTSDCITLYGARNCIVDGNTILGPSYDGIYMERGAQWNIVRYNKVLGAGLLGNGITFGELLTGKNTAYYNLVTDAGCGIYVNGSTTTDSIGIYNNTVYDSTGSGAGIHVNGTVTHCRIFNNAVYVTGSDASIQVDATAVSGVTMDNNDWFHSPAGVSIYWNGSGYSAATFATYQSASGQDAHGFSSDPLFVQTGYNFALQSGSPCKNTGTTLTYTLDILGNIVPYPTTAVDIGAYEYQGP